MSVPDPSVIQPGYQLFDSLVSHAEMVEQGGGIVASVSVISQIAINRNFALRGTISGLKSTYSVEEPLEMKIDLLDFANYVQYLEIFTFNNCSIDWESDGVIDYQSGRVGMHDSLGRTALSTRTSGYMYGELEVEHAYSAPGDYLITLYLKDLKDITTMQVPITVTPEPATLSMFGLGSFFFLKRKCRKERV